MTININDVFLLMLLSLFLLAGCGQKGDLYLPDLVEQKIVKVEKSDDKTQNNDKNLKRKE